MLVPDPAQAVAVCDWLAAALNTDDTGAPIAPPPFGAGTVFPGDRDHPRATRFARVATVALVGRGLCHRYVATDVGLPTQALTEERWEHLEWTTSITVASRLDPQAPALADSAGVLLRRALGARRGVAAVPLHQAGVTYLRGLDVTDTSRLVGTTTWETRATATVVWLCGWRAQGPVEWLGRVVGQGGVGASLPFDSAEGA